jgi:hypothetical protein
MATERHAEVFRAFYDTLVEPAPDTLDWTELEARFVEAEALPRRRSKWLQPVPSRARRWAWVLATAVLALVLIGGALLLLQQTEEPPVITQPTPVSTTLPPPTTVPPPTTTPTTLAVPLSPMTWRLANVPSLLTDYNPDGLGDIMFSVTADESGWVAAGATAYQFVGGEPTDPGWVAAFWTSVDGIDWQRVPHEDAVFGNSEEFYVVADITAGGPGFVAVGNTLDREGYDLTQFAEYVVWGMGSDYQDAAVWLSEDGRSWTRVESEGLGGPGWQMLTGVTTGGPGLVAVGLDGELGSAAWTSVDGTDWLKVDFNPFIDESGGWPIVWDVSADTQGLMAVGNIDLVPTVWTSLDGVSWESSQLSDPLADIRGETQAVVRLGETIVGAGFAAEDVGMGEHVAGLWVSNDAGTTWSQVPPFTSTVRQTDLFGLVATPSGLVAGAQQYDWNDPDWSRTAIWISRDDGDTWEKIPHEDEVFGGYGETAMKLFDLAALGDTVVGVGAMRGDPAAWVGEWNE